MTTLKEATEGAQEEGTDRSEVLRKQTLPRIVLWAGALILALLLVGFGWQILQAISEGASRAPAPTRHIERGAPTPRSEPVPARAAPSKSRAEQLEELKRQLKPSILPSIPARTAPLHKAAATKKEEPAVSRESLFGNILTSVGWCDKVYSRKEYTEYTIINPNDCQLRWQVEEGCIEWLRKDGRKLHTGIICESHRPMIGGLGASPYALRPLGNAVVSITRCHDKSEGNQLKECR